MRVCTAWDCCKSRCVSSSPTQALSVTLWSPGEIEILPALFGKIIIPTVVRDELTRPRAPEAVRTWMQAPPPWLEPRVAPASAFDIALERLDEGESAALLLAASLNADLLLLDDREGARVALERGFGGHGHLASAATRGEAGCSIWLMQLSGSSARISGIIRQSSTDCWMSRGTSRTLSRAVSCSIQRY